MSLNWISGRVAKKQDWFDGLFTLSIECPGVKPFECGQFLQVGFPMPEKHLHRPYSVASPHGDLLEFFIVRVEGGQLTPLLWDLKPGDPIEVSEKATGSFTLSHCMPTQCIWLLATGTGLAPYVAMLRDPLIWDRYQSIVLVHGVRYANDLAYVDEFKALENAQPDRFKWIPVVSREAVPNAIEGRITQALENGTLESAAGHRLYPDTSMVMMCGNPQMLNDVESMLLERGMKKHKHSEPGHYVVERYW